MMKRILASLLLLTASGNLFAGIGIKDVAAEQVRANRSVRQESQPEVDSSSFRTVSDSFGTESTTNLMHQDVGLSSHAVAASSAARSESEDDNPFVHDPFRDFGAEEIESRIALKKNAIKQLQREVRDLHRQLREVRQASFAFE